jgi:hypothetical protein
MFSEHRWCGVSQEANVGTYDVYTAEGLLFASSVPPKTALNFVPDA